MKRWLEDEGAAGDAARARRLLAEVEAPSSAPGAKARVWARLARPARSRPPLLRIALAGGLVGAFAVALLVTRTPVAPTEVSVRAVRSLGSVLVEGQPLALGQALPPGATLALGPQAEAWLVGAASGPLYLKGGAQLSFLDAEGRRLRLLAGLLERTGPGSAVVVVEAAEFELAATGAFRVQRFGEAIEVEIHSGRAELRGPGFERVLEAGERYSSWGEAAAPVGAPGLELGAEAAGPGSPPARRAPLAGSSEASSRAAVSGLRVRRQPVPPPAAAPAPSSDLPASQGAAVDDEPGRPRGPVEGTPLEASSAPNPSAGTPPIPSRGPLPAPAPTALGRQAIGEPDWAALYRQAQQAGGTARAVGLYDRIAEGPSVYAEVAGHQAARLVMRQDAARAVPRYQRLLARFPKGAYVPEGRLNLIECRLITGDLAGASRELDAFLSEYPSSERTAELLRMKEALAQRQKE